MFRLAAYEDLRHLLKHKRSYVPEALTPSERRILARKSLPTRIWMATGKRVYYGITRGVFGFTDREGGGPRLVNDAPRIAAALKADPRVRDAVVVAFPDRRAGTGLYAFVETAAPYRNSDIDAAAAASGARPPERLQVVDGAAAHRSGRHPHRYPAARRHEPGRSDRSAGQATPSASSSRASSPAAKICATDLRFRLLGKPNQAARSSASCCRHCGTSIGMNGS